MHPQDRRLPSFEQAMELLHHAEGEILRGEAQARVFLALNVAVAGAARLVAEGPPSLVLFLAAVGGAALGCVALLSGGEGGRQMKDARQALYLDAIGERDSFADFLRTFTILSANPGERVLHAVYLRSIRARRKQRLVRALGAVTLANLAGAALVLAVAWP